MLRTEAPKPKEAEVAVPWGSVDPNQGRFDLQQVRLRLVVEIQPGKLDFHLPDRMK